MIREDIRAAFHWWAKHPWMAFWSITLFAPLSIMILGGSDLGPLGPLSRKLFVSALLLLLIAWILSFIRGVFVTWQRAGIIAVLIDVVVPLIVVGYLAAIAIPQYASRRRRGYDGEVKADVRLAANAEEAYYKVNGTYTARIDSLPGFNQVQSDNVNITIEATAITYVITGTMTKGCEANTGTWFIDSTTGKIDGTSCR